jgi:hypothetical protein
MWDLLRAAVTTFVGVAGAQLVATCGEDGGCYEQAWLPAVIAGAVAAVRGGYLQQQPPPVRVPPPAAP